MPPTIRCSRYNGWFPRHREVHKIFIEKKITNAAARKERITWGGIEEAHSAPVARFAAAVLGNSVIRDLFKQIFLQVNTNPRWTDPNLVVTDFQSLFHLLDVIVNEPPAYYRAKRADGTIIGEPVGVPLYIVFDMLSNTSAAYDLFRYEAFNATLKELLDSWGTYLTSGASISTLTTRPDGWFGEEAIAHFQSYIQPLSFDATYICPDPSMENKGFPSWDAFFTREFQPKARPVVLPDDSYLIHNACESTMIRYATNVKLHDTFWLKGQAYSLYDILNKNDEDAAAFVGGTIYQGFLSLQDYHRWHSPVKGTITKACVVPGTYYAALPDSGAPAGDPDFEEGDPHGALVRSQPWLTVSATRALVFIQADNADIGLVCFVGIGMGEVSTCEITVQAGQQVAIGEELGMFHFGGSSHAVLFGPQAEIIFEDQNGQPIKENNHYWINAVIGRVVQN